MLDELRDLFLAALKFDGEDAMPLVRDWNLAVKHVQEYFNDLTYKDPNAVPVVRCRDCKHRVKNSCDSVEFYECDHMGLGQTRVGVKDDFFCADGERKGGTSDA